MNNSSTYFNLLRESTLAYFDRMNPGVLKRQPGMPSHLMTGGGDVLEQYKTYIKEHQGEWYKSQEFADMFVRCPPGALLSVARTYFSSGNFVRAGVNLSERVIECLESAFNMFSQEQHTFPNADMCKMTINYLKALKVEQGFHNEELKTNNTLGGHSLLKITSPNRCPPCSNKRGT